MYARFTHYERLTHDSALSTAYAVERELPSVTDLPGFSGSFVLVDADGGQAGCLTLWASKADLQHSERVAAEGRSAVAGQWCYGTHPDVSVYEVLDENSERHAVSDLTQPAPKPLAAARSYEPGPGRLSPRRPHFSS
jgi:hypothetical protein